jgi:hypothetical protein
VLAVRRATTLKPSYGSRLKARGAFVAVRIDVKNTGSATRSSISYDTRLRIGRRTYKYDGDASFELGNMSMWPLAPGARGVTVVVFDVPPAVARRALRSGAVVLPFERDGTSDSIKRGVARLERGSTRPQPRSQPRPRRRAKPAPRRTARPPAPPSALPAPLPGTVRRA